MKLSSREVFQLADRCLASAGLSRGASKANAKSIWWTEVYRERGLTALHTIIEESPTLDPAMLSLEDQTSVFSIVDSGHQPSIVSSTAALDFSCSQAKQEGIGITYSSIPASDSSFPTIGHTAYNAANRGMVSVVLTEYPDGSGSFIGVPGRPHPIVVETELKGPSSSYTKLLGVIDSGLYRQRHSPLVQAFFDPGEGGGRFATDAATLKRLLEGATEPNPGGVDSDERGFFTICIDPNHPRNSAEIRRVADQFVDERADTLTTVHRPSEIRERGRALIEEGVDVEERVWEELFEFSNGIFSPDSLGSETGAGPGLER
jgi:LDH2 family malate/lactate/ureidoglycolate dehydrogenase